MRAIIDYENYVDRADRKVSCQVLLTPVTGGAAIDVSDYLTSAQVTDSLDPGPSTAVVAFEIPEGLAWGDPATDADSPMQAGAHIAILMGERGSSMTRIFDGEIVEAHTTPQGEVDRATLQAVSGKASWYGVTITSPVYTSTDSDLIVTDLFETYGGLTAPADFDLPGDARIIASMRTMQKTLWEIAALLYAPAARVPFWDPEQQKLSTLPLDIPLTEDLTIAVSQSSGFEITSPAPEATRVAVDAGTLLNVERVEVDKWPTVSQNLWAPFGSGVYFEGVRWASGGISDKLGRIAPVEFVGDPSVGIYWADPADREGTKTLGAYVAGYWLYVEFAQNLMETGYGKDGYKGPEGVEFQLNNPAVTTDPVSIAVLTDCTVDFSFCTVEVFDEEFSAAEDCQRCYVRLGIDATDIGWSPAPAGKTAKTWWEEITADSDFRVAWEIKGRQLMTDGQEQLSAQAWDDTLIALYGEKLLNVSNETLLLESDAAPTPTRQRAAVEEEALRQMAVILAKQHIAPLNRDGQDLRLLPGDCIKRRHVRDAKDCLCWLWAVTQSFSNGKGDTQLTTYVVAAT